MNSDQLFKAIPELAEGRVRQTDDLYPDWLLLAAEIDGLPGCKDTVIVLPGVRLKEAFKKEDK